MRRSLSHRTVRPLERGRHHSRMLDGARRPRRANYLTIACRALEEFLRLEKRMRPHIEEQIQLAEHQKWVDSFEPALRAVYGPPKAPSEPPPVRQLTRRQIDKLMKDEKALTKTLLTVANLKTKLWPHGRQAVGTVPAFVELAVPRIFRDNCNVSSREIVMDLGI